MKRILIGISAALVASSALISCDDTATTIGSSLVTDKSEVVIDSLFTLIGVSVENSNVQSRTLTQMLGVLDAKEYGRFSSDIVTQFMAANNLDTVGVTSADIDSLKLVLFMASGDFTGDSLVPMGFKVFPLTRALPSPIYSDFDPTDYYSEQDIWASQVYTANALHNDSLNNLSYRTISVLLPVEFGRRMFTEYENNPATFASPQAFAKFFPGLYIKNSFGSGRVININETRINVYYHSRRSITDSQGTRDTTINLARTYLAVTPEVITNNVIRLDISSALTDRVAAGEQILVAPAGYDVEMTFPAPAILESYRTKSGELSVVNTLTMQIPVEEIVNDYSIAPPQHVLLVLKKEKDAFFASNKINDNRTSFLAVYNEATKSYDFTDMRQYFLDLLAKEDIKAEDYTFTLTPVNVQSESTGDSYYSSGNTYITAIQPYVTGPAFARLLLSDAKIKLTYSNQSINF